MIDGVDHIVSNRRQQVVEHRRRFDLVLYERVALPVCTQTDAFAHIIDRRQVLDPSWSITRIIQRCSTNRISSGVNCCSRRS